MIKLYMDHNVPSAITSGLRILGVDVLTAYEDKQHQTADPELLDRAAALERVLFTRDDDFISEASRRQREAIPFYGIVFMVSSTHISYVYPLEPRFTI